MLGFDRTAGERCGEGEGSAIALHALARTQRFGVLPRGRLMSDECRVDFGHSQDESVKIKNK